MRTDSLVESHTWTLLTPDMEKFVPDMESDDNRMEIRKNWDMLMPRKFILTSASGAID